METGLKNRVAIVAASSQGIGKATAEAFAAEGCRVAMCARNGETLKAAADRIRSQHGVDVYAEPIDVSDADAVRRSLDRLSPDQRTAVVLRYYAHLSEQQMAHVLGVAPGTVKSRLSRALRLLADDPHLSDLRGAP